jgi:hypothetical protein
MSTAYDDKAIMVALPWEDETLAADQNNAPKREPLALAAPRQLSASEITALGLPVDDPFWMLPKVFDAYLRRMNQVLQTTEQFPSLGPNAPAAQLIRRAVPCRAPLPPLDPREKEPSSEQLPETVRQAISIIATPRMPGTQVLGAAVHLLDWHKNEYRHAPEIKEMVLWWWKAARRHVDIREVWADEMRAIWKTAALDPAKAPVNAFYGHLAHRAARTFIAAKGHLPDDKVGRELLRDAGFPPPDKRRNPSNRILTTSDRISELD